MSQRTAPWPAGFLELAAAGAGISGELTFGVSRRRKPAYRVSLPDGGSRLALLEEELDKPGDVVLSGALIPWGNPLIPRFTLVVRLEAETQLRLERLKARERADFGSRIEPGGDMYQDFLEFLEYARGYDTGGLNMRSRARHDAWEKLLPCPVLHLDGAAPLEETVEEVRRALERMES